MPYKSIYLSGGINRNTSPFLIEDGETTELQNFTTTKIGVLKKTGDYELKNAQITASYNMLGGVDFQRADGTHEHYVAVDGASNAGIYKDVAGTWTTQSQALTKGNKVRFSYCPPLDTLFACNYADVTRSYNGTSWSTSTNVTSAPKAKYTIYFGDRIYLLNTVVGANSYVNRAYRSSTVETSPITWDTTNDWITFYDVITGVGKNGENMFVGCQNSCWVFTLLDARYQVSAHGCVSNDGITEYGSWTFFPSYDGMYVFDGSTDTKISLPVQDYWDAILYTSLGSIQAKVLGHHLYIFIGDVTVGGRSLSNVVLDYNILQNNWTRMSLNENIMDTHLYTESDSGRELFFGNDDGEVFQMFESSTQNAGVFTSFIETPWFYGSGPRIIDTFEEIWGHGEKLSGLKVKYKVDDGDWIPAGELNGFSGLLKISARGKRIKFLLEETSKNNLFELHSLEVGFSPKFPEFKENDNG
jgi:hypothetical protein